MMEAIDWSLAERAGPAIIAIMGLGWWLSGRFRKSEERADSRIDKLADDTRLQLNEHENRDQFRHEENLRRFEKISVGLVKLGLTNGTHG